MKKTALRDELILDDRFFDDGDGMAEDQELKVCARGKGRMQADIRFSS